jgi:MspA
MPRTAVFVRPVAVGMACVLSCLLTAPSSAADPDTDQVQPVAAEASHPDVAPVDDGRVASPPPQVLKTPDGWTLTLAAKDETQMASAPLTTALSSREYTVGGTFDGKLSGPSDGNDPSGTIEVGYQIGCGIDMSTSNGVSLTGTAGLNASIGVTDIVTPLPGGILPGVGANIGGGVTVGLKPGIINIVPVTKKEFEGAEPWVMISNFHVKIDGCVGQSFIRSYAFLTRSTKMSDAIVAYYGETKAV